MENNITSGNSYNKNTMSINNQLNSLNVPISHSFETTSTFSSINPIDNYSQSNNNKNNNNNINLSQNPIYFQSRHLNSQIPSLTNAEYKFKKGLYMDEYQRRRIKSIYVDINSAFRNKKPIVQHEEAILLENDPLIFESESNMLFIKHENSGFEIGDHISLNGVVSRKSILRTFRGTNLPTFDIPPGCNFIKMYCNHNTPLNSIIKIDGVKGDRGNNEFLSFIGSIPINIINRVHSIKLTLDDKDIQNQTQYVKNLRNDPNYFEPSSDYFFILLPIKMHAIENPYTLTDYNFKIVFKSICGIPLNIINECHIIRDISDDGYTIELPRNTCLLANNIICNGGNCVYVAKIITLHTGFPNPNNYTINLQNIFHNVIAVNLISTEFPNTKKLIKSNINNKLYWNSIKDGDYLYSIEIDEGNYTPEQLINEINNSFSKVKCINDSNHCINVKLNNNTGEVIFNSYREYVLINSIVEVNIVGNMMKLIINHPNHNIMNVGTEIIIKNANDYKGIFGNVINGNYIINKILDMDKYIITIPKSEYDGRKKTINHNMVIYVPDLFRLRFDQLDSLGNILGFKNCGELNAITDYQSEISNNDKYEFEYCNNDGEIICKNNVLQFCGHTDNDNYIIMVMEPIKTLYTLGKIKNAFAKIQLCGYPGEMLYDTFVPIYYIYDNPLKELYKLSISFYHPDGTLFDFNCIDHSFTLEIVTVVDIPEDTSISANTGKNYNYDVV